MGNPELCILPDSILPLLETDNTEKAKEVIKNGIKRIDRGMASGSTDTDQKQTGSWINRRHRARCKALMD